MFPRIFSSGAVNKTRSIAHRRQLSRRLEAPQMPPTDFVPKPYKGPAYDSVKKIKEDHVVPCILPYYKEPLLIHQGYMQWLFDYKGNRYLDMFGGVVTVSVGHCHPKVVAAAKEQLDTLWHTTNIYLHPKLYEYAEKLTSTLPDNLKVVYFVNSGSEANDLALMLARAYTGNFDVISLRNGYHGASPYCASLTALSSWKFPFPVNIGVHHAQNPDVYQGQWGGSNCRDSPVQTDRKCSCEPGKCEASQRYYEQLEEIFRYSVTKGRVAGFFAESIQGIGGAVQYPKGYLKKAYELVKSNGGLCVADEVQTGFGRTGETFWGFEAAGVKPDIVTMAKGIGNGFPLAAVVTSHEVSRFLGHAHHFNTFGGNPLACHIGMATLKVIEEEALQKNSHVVGTHLLTNLAKLREEFTYVGDVRGKGLMIGLELVKDKGTREPLGAKKVASIWEACREMGLLVGRGGCHGNVLRIKPPMCITKEDADFTVDVLRLALKQQSSTSLY